MRFTTIAKSGDSYEVLAGATFQLGSIGHHECICTSSVEHGGRNLRPSGYTLIGNEMLFTADARARLVGLDCKLTVMKAAVRMGDLPLLVPESEAARCEVQHPAHVVHILDRYGNSSEFCSSTYCEFDTQDNQKLQRQILMPGLAIIAEGDILRVNMVQTELRETGGIFLVRTPIKEIVESFTVSFDGTNVKLDGVNVKVKAQECFV
jgi:hypothetical protein